jgi:hypothetical protein
MIYFLTAIQFTERSPNIRDHKPEADRSRSDFENWQQNREQKNETKGTVRTLLTFNRLIVSVVYARLRNTLRIIGPREWRFSRDNELERNSRWLREGRNRAAHLELHFRLPNKTILTGSSALGD